MARNWNGDELTSMAEACDHCAARANEPCVLGCECPACLERRAEVQARARDIAPALMFERGWPFTKAAYLVAATLPDMPDFPLDAELKASIPPDLEGDVPTSEEEYDRVLLSLPDPPAAGGAGSLRRTRRQVGRQRRDHE